MHHDASRDVPPISFIKPHATEGAAKALFCWNIIEACEAREHGSDSKQNHQVEGAIIQTKEWTRMFGAVQPRGSRGHKATKEHGVHWRKLKSKGVERTPGRSAKLAGLPPS
jgi:hypothetical protein